MKVGFSDGLYGRSKGSLTYSGWTCEHLPYLVEIDNWGGEQAAGGRRKRAVSGSGAMMKSPGSRIRVKNIAAIGCSYAWDWVRATDSNGHLEMPGSRTMTSPRDRKRWYYANTPSGAPSS